MAGKYFGADPSGGLFFNGARGVDLFFLISGFIITVICLDENLVSRVTVSDFAAKRFLRIVPIMWLAIISYALLRMEGRGVFDAQGALRAMTLSPVGELQPTNIWTLRHEALFYVVFAVAMLGPRRLWPLLAVWCVLPLMRALVVSEQGPGSMGWDLLRCVANPVNVEFGMGVLAAIAWLRFGRGRQYGIPVHPYWVMLAMFAGLVYVSYQASLTFTFVRQTTLSGLLCAPILAFGVVACCPDGPVHRLALLLGNASYSIYLFHPHLISALLGAWSHFGRSTPPLIVIVGVTILGTAGGVVVHLLLERPMLHALSRRFRKGRLAPG